MFEIFYNHHKPLVFVGTTGLNKQLAESLDQPVVVISLEEAKKKNKNWIDDHQFMCVTGDYNLKKQVTDYLSSYNASYFSMIGKNNLITPDIKIGKNTFINNYNDLLGAPLTIGDHVIISCFCQLGRDVIIKDYCHISSYVYVNNCHVGEGTALGTRASVLGPKLSDNDTKHIAPMCNFLANSVITKNITETGTYFGNKRSNKLSREQYRII